LYKRFQTRSVGLDQGLEKGGVGSVVAAAAMEITERRKERKGRRRGLVGLHLNLKCRARTEGAAQDCAAPSWMAPHLSSWDPPSRRGSVCCAMENGAAHSPAAPPCAAWKKKVSPVKNRPRFII
jgi:hypothetical protein